MEALIKIEVYLSILSLFVASASSSTATKQPLAAVVPADAPPDSPRSLADQFPFATPISTEQHFSFFMHDIVGGFNPSARPMTGIVNNPAVKGKLPFAKPNNLVFPVNRRVINNNILFFTGLGGPTSNVQPGISGLALQQLMFGTITVMDDELTERHELGSGLVGRAQGFYVASSIDGNSQTMAFTAMFASGNYVDSLSFLGVYRVGVSESQLAIMGGTGKYVNAKGFAIVKIVPPNNQQDLDERLETVLQLLVYVTC